MRSSWHTLLENPKPTAYIGRSSRSTSRSSLQPVLHPRSYCSSESDTLSPGHGSKTCSSHPLLTGSYVLLLQNSAQRCLLCHDLLPLLSPQSALSSTHPSCRLWVLWGQRLWFLSLQPQNQAQPLAKKRYLVGLNSSAVRGLGMSVTTIKSTCCHYSANSSAIHFTEARLRHVPDRPAKRTERPGRSKPWATVLCAGSLYSHQLSRAYMLCLFPDLLMLAVHPVSMQFNSVTDEMWVRKKKESFIWILHQCFKKIYGGE